MDRALLIATALLFILVNTFSLWDSWLGPFAFLAFMIMAGGFLILCLFTLFQIIVMIKERFAIRAHMVNAVITVVLLATMYVYPRGLIRFDQFSEDDLLVAGREGSANCNTTIRLKENNRFVETSVCFGVTEVSGNFELKGDTILFKDIQLGRHTTGYYDYAIIKTATSTHPSSKGTLVSFKNGLDKVGRELWIAQNNLNQD